MPKLPKFLEVKEDDTKKEKKKKRFLLILFIILFFLVAVGIILGIVFGVRSCSKSNKSPTSNITSNTSSNTGATSEPAPSDVGYINYALNDDGISYKVTGLKATYPTEIVIPNTYEGKPVTKIGVDALRNKTDVTSVVLPSTIIDIEDGAFNKCSSLTSINLPEGITSISEAAFMYCTSLKEINIPASVSIIKDAAFNECDDLEKVTFASGSILETIESNSFSDCPSLKDVVLPETVKTIESNAFLNCHKDLYTEYNGAYYFGTPSKPYWLLEKVLDNTVTTFEINENCLTIDYEVFKDFASLVSITIPSKVERIYIDAFMGCSSLSSVTFASPTSLTYLDNGLFHNCSSLTSFTVPSTVTYMGYYLFSNTGLTNLVFENEFSELPEEIIDNCDLLESITLPASLSVIHKDDFKDAEALQTINFGGTKEEWNSINKEENWDKNLTNLTLIHCIDEDIIL